MGTGFFGEEECSICTISSNALLCFKTCCIECLYKYVNNLIKEKNYVHKVYDIETSDDNTAYDTNENVTIGTPIVKIRFYAKTLRKTGDEEWIGEYLKFNRNLLEKPIHDEQFNEKMEDLLK